MQDEGFQDHAGEVLRRVSDGVHGDAAESVSAEHTPAVPPRSLAERLFTPENVRILQSLGIGIIFISAVALIRNQVWGGATPLQRLGILIGGTGACYALGFGLYRWTSLRITGLAFIILSELSLILDAYAALLIPAAGQSPLYPYAPASLWTLTFLLFTAASQWHARSMKEALFDAFTIFGALAAWGSAALWLKIDWLLLPASFVPAALLCRVGAHFLTPEHGARRRWSLEWWLSASWQFGSMLLALAVIAAALWSDQYYVPAGDTLLVANFGSHALAIVALAIGCLTETGTLARWMAHLGGALLAFVVLLAAMVLPLNETQAILLMTLPTFIAAIAALVLAEMIPEHRQRFSILAGWANLVLNCASLFSLANCVCVFCTPVVSLVHLCPPTLAAVVAILYAVRGGLLFPWLAAAHLIIFGLLLPHVFGWPQSSRIAIWLSTAVILNCVYWFLEKQRVPLKNAVAESGFGSAHLLALLAGLELLFGGGSGAWQVCGWWALVAYLIGASFLRKSSIVWHVAVLLSSWALIATLREAGRPEVLAPSLAGLTLLAFAAEMFVSRRTRQCYGAATTITLLALQALCFTFFAWLADEREWVALSCALLMIAGFSGAIMIRRVSDVFNRAIFGLELFGWLMLVFAVWNVAAIYELPFDGAGWALLGAILLALGMAGESLAGMVLTPERHSRTPSPLLESRFIAAAGLAAVGVLSAFSARQPLLQPGVIASWQSLFSAALIAIYMSMAQSSNNKHWNEFIRLSSSVLAFVVLLPGAYLCLLKSMSSGSSWGALYFMLLIPVLAAAAYVLKRENLIFQARMAEIGIVLVNAGAVVLAFTNNRENLAMVPACVFALIAAQAALARRFGPQFLTHASAVFASASLLFCVRALVGVGALPIAPWFGEMAVLSLIGVALLAIGAMFKLDPDAENRSSVAVLGFGICVFAVTLAGMLWLMFGSDARMLPGRDVARLDAFIACVLLMAGSCVGARHWMKFDAGAYLAPTLALFGYTLFVFKQPITQWEWITLPVAAFFFLWAREHAREGEGEHIQAQINVLLGFASAAALIPSFIQALPYDKSALYHALLVFLVGMGLVLGAMATRRKVPLLSATGTILLLTLVKAIQWAAHREEILLPFVGIVIGFGVVALGTLFEARMNRAIRGAVDRAKAEARMFWMSWQ
ncbi:MAG TPA: hypothetical protein VEJ63_14035 [Planctomycetota bacterium]|nr:hypothetical protein [Planctomycetota bacterium]